MIYKAVLFDLDGTLLDTLKDLTDAVNRGLSRMGFPQHDAEVIKYFVGNGREALALRSLPEMHRDEASLAQLLDYINEEYLASWQRNTAPYAGIPELLEALAKRGIKLAILSNKPHEFTELMVSRLLSQWQFEIVLGSLPGLPHKPDPASALDIARRMEIRPQEFLYLGDSDVDMQTAVAANMYPVGALWGFRTLDELKQGGARSLIQCPEELLELL